MKSKYCFAIAVVVALSGFSAPAFADGDAKRGEALFKRVCRACHTVEGDQNRVGPYLAGVWERPVASAKGYHYTKAMRAYGDELGKWNEAAMEAFLMNPRKTVKGTRMAYAGIREPGPASDLAAYLKSLPTPE